MKLARTAILACLVVSPALTQLACQDSFKDCADTSSCPPEGDGDGDLGGSGGDGDGDGDLGGTGGGESEACDPACAGDTVCDEVTEECVECLKNTDCKGEEKFCSVLSECVSCIETTDCTGASASKCEAGGCVECEANEDCAHLAGTSVCDAGTCVECTPETDDRVSTTDVCGAGVCNPETLECEDGLVQAGKDICDSCIADSECLTGQNCIPLEYTGGAETAALGGFCMKIYPGCSAPYEAGAIERASLSGASAIDYCGLAEEFTTCAAIEDLKDGKLCDDDLDCGTEHGEGRCETVNGGGETKCTYSCAASAECPSTFPCDGTVGDEYCGG